MFDLLGFQPQYSDIKLQGLHEEALYMTLNRCHDLSWRHHSTITVCKNIGTS